MASEEEKMQGILETVDQQEMVGICGRNDEFLRLIRVLLTVQSSRAAIRLQ